jgi:hypothetical protein
MTRQDALKQGYELMSLLNKLMEEHNITKTDIADYAFNLEILNKVECQECS